MPRRPAPHDTQQEPTADEAPSLPGPAGVTSFVLAEDTVLLRLPFPAAQVPSGLLTAAEEEVVLAVYDGASNREIATQRGTSVKTVANQLVSIYEKLRVTSRVELVLRLRGGG